MQDTCWCGGTPGPPPAVFGSLSSKARPATIFRGWPVAVGVLNRNAVAVDIDPVRPGKGWEPVGGTVRGFDDRRHRTTWPRSHRFGSGPRAPGPERRTIRWNTIPHTPETTLKRHWHGSDEVGPRARSRPAGRQLPITGRTRPDRPAPLLTCGAGNPAGRRAGAAGPDGTPAGRPSPAISAPTGCPIGRPVDHFGSRPGSSRIC